MDSESRDRIRAVIARLADIPDDALVGHRCKSWYFDRTVCPEPCSDMHDRCTECGRVFGTCHWEDPMDDGPDCGA